jgi:formate/nitrite transporter FocA (FNT family)
MRTLLASSAVFLTIVLSLAFGIACGYVVITAILRAMAQKPEPAKAAAPVAAIATSQSGS